MSCGRTTTHLPEASENKPTDWHQICRRSGRSVSDLLVCRIPFLCRCVYSCLSRSNVTNPDIETEYNLSVNKSQYIYLPSTTDDELSRFQHQTTDDKTADQLHFPSNTNRPLLYLSHPTNRNNRKSNIFPPEIIYTSPDITSQNPIIDTPSDIIYISGGKALDFRLFRFVGW